MQILEQILGDSLKWISETMLVRDLKEYEHNPRSITKRDFDNLVKSIKEDGYHKRIIVDTHNVIIGGHSRKRALLAAGYAYSDIIEVLKPSRELTEEEFKRLNIRDNINFGDFDFDILANNFEMQDLEDWGMDLKLFPNVQETAEETKPLGDTEEVLKCSLCGK